MEVTDDVFEEGSEAQPEPVTLDLRAVVEADNSRLFMPAVVAVIRAVTIHATKSMGREGQIGSLGCGKEADIIVLDAPNYRYLPYHFGVDHVEFVIKKGKIVYRHCNIPR